MPAVLQIHEWCLQHDIKPETFYNWVKRLRQKCCPELPDATDCNVPHRQEVVKIELTSPDKVTEKVMLSLRLRFILFNAVLFIFLHLKRQAKKSMK